MLEFIAKVWAAGEINDFRRNRKKRKQQEKILKQNKARQRVAELGIIEEKIKGNNDLDAKYKRIGNCFSISALIIILSLFLTLFFPFAIIIGIVNIPIVSYYGVKLNKLKREILND
ncbi:hypothetical protein [Clostridium phage vB_CpeS-17DYC]|nr:hypothetical protein [Clostridium phage vB_CpeS-17DYC]